MLIALGVYFRHVLPGSLIHSVPDDAREWKAWYESSLKKEQPIILYLHGNKGSRAESHRVELYNKLRRMDYHIIAFDYRGNSIALIFRFSKNYFIHLKHF